jgi:transcriptional regulator with XRE-family HTH domain
MKNLRTVRELWGVSQGNVAENTGVSQQSYARYEKGQTDKIPHGFIIEFARHYMVDVAWLEGKPRQWDISRVKSMIADSLPEAAKRLHLPQPFLAAVCAGEVMGSGELYSWIQGEFGQLRDIITPASWSERQIREIFPRIDALEALLKNGGETPNLAIENARLKSDVATLTTTLDNLNAYVLDLRRQLGSGES